MHVCCSDAEGFGHYINEGRAHGALVRTVTTDAAPMNELVDESCGLLVAPSEYGGTAPAPWRGWSGPWWTPRAWPPPWTGCCRSA